MYRIGIYFLKKKKNQPTKIKMSMYIVAITDFQFVVCFDVYPNITVTLLEVL